ncbi:MAG: hypothetical protein V3S60_10450 [Acidimicrobiia bacterium]
MHLTVRDDAVLDDDGELLAYLVVRTPRIEIGNAVLDDGSHASVQTLGHPYLKMQLTWVIATSDLFDPLDDADRRRVGGGSGGSTSPRAPARRS